MTSELYLNLTSANDINLAGAPSTRGLGCVIAAHQAATHGGSLAVRIEHRPFVIDPLTSRFDPRLRWTEANDGDLKPSYQLLAQRYFQGLSERSVDPAVLTATDLERYVENVLRFQVEAITADDTGVAAFDIGRQLERTRRHPESLLAPYVLVTNAASFNGQRRLWSSLPESLDGLTVDRVLAIHPRVLADPLLIGSLSRFLPVDGRRTWLALPEFRRYVHAGHGRQVAWNGMWLMRVLAGIGEVCVLTAGFELMTIAARFARAISCGAHLGDGRVAHRDGGSAHYMYVTAVHGWERSESVAKALASAATSAAASELFCTEAECLANCDKVGPSAFARLIAGRPASNLELAHRLRARAFELSEVSDVALTELPMVLRQAARRSPFTIPARNLGYWAALLTDLETLAA